ncbi:hypothetical protein J6590_048332 [Homalodisca vitripennis]|nr:hypothetical protein J6590_048332 [Homalodisca vitripennis]
MAATDSPPPQWSPLALYSVHIVRNINGLVVEYDHNHYAHSQLRSPSRITNLKVPFCSRNPFTCRHLLNGPRDKCSRGCGSHSYSLGSTTDHLSHFCSVIIYSRSQKQRNSFLQSALSEIRKEDVTLIGRCEISGTFPALGAFHIFPTLWRARRRGGRHAISDAPRNLHNEPQYGPHACISTGRARRLERVHCVQNGFIV